MSILKNNLIKRIMALTIISATLITTLPIGASAYTSSSELKDNEMFEKAQEGKITFDEYYDYITDSDNNEDGFDVTLNDINNDFNNKTLTFNKFCDYLNKHYDSIDTPIGKIYCSFDFIENNSSVMPYNYWLQTKGVGMEDSKYGFETFDISYITDNINVSQEDKDTTKQLLQNYQYNVATMAIKYFADKKIWGGYYDGWYKYPALRVDWQSESFDTWKNYDGNVTDGYYGSQLSGFQWDTSSDGYSF